MSENPLDRLFPGLMDRIEDGSGGFMEGAQPSMPDHDDERDDEATIPPRSDRRPTDGNKGFRHDVGRRHGRRSTHTPHYRGGRLV